MKPALAEVEFPVCCHGMDVNNYVMKNIVEKEGIFLIDLIKDLIKIFVYGILEFFMDITITKGTREYIKTEKGSSTKGKRIFRQICFLITLSFIGFFYFWGFLILCVKNLQRE